MPFVERDESNRFLVIEGFEEFQNHIKGLEEQAAKSNELLFFLFTGSEGPDGKSWCPDCVEFEKVWEEFKKKDCPEKGRLIRVKVGTREYWKDKACPFRTEKSLALSSIPTLVKWGTPQRLSDDQITNHDLLAMIFEED